METDKKPGELPTGQDTLEQAPQKKSSGAILMERKYLKTLNGTWTSGNEGRVFVMPLPNRKKEP